MSETCVNAAAYAEDRAAAGDEDRAALFFDVDGTLLWTDFDNMPESGDFNDILPDVEVYEAFEELNRRGHLTFLCTGRPLSLVNSRLLDLGFSGCISGAGSCVSFGDKIVYESVLDSAAMMELARMLLDAGATAMLEARETPVIVSATLDGVEAFPDVPVAHSLEEIERLAPELRFCKITQPTIMVDQPLFEDGRIKEFIERNFDICDMGLAAEITQKGVTKGTGIARAMEYLGRGLENTFAFGDSENDLPMFGVVETKVAMGNAMPVLKERADYVTTHVREGGVPHALRHFGLI